MVAKYTLWVECKGMSKVKGLWLTAITLPYYDIVIFEVI